jgi:hypothetical protein
MNSATRVLGWIYVSFALCDAAENRGKHYSCRSIDRIYYVVTVVQPCQNIAASKRRTVFSNGGNEGTAVQPVIDFTVRPMQPGRRTAPALSDSESNLERGHE